MGDFLDTTVESCDVRYDHTKITLQTNYVISQAKFSSSVLYGLPFALGLEKGDKLSFFAGCVRGLENPVITHKDYISVDITRKDKLIARFNGVDLHILEHFTRRQESLQSSNESNAVSA